MLGASVYVVPLMIHRNVPGIGDWVLPAFLFAAVPAGLAALAYSILSSAMPRAGGSYIYSSRGLHPWLGFVASFSQWFGLSIVIGVIAYIIVPFFRDIAIALDWTELAALLETGFVLMPEAAVHENHRLILAEAQSMQLLPQQNLGFGVFMANTGHHLRTFFWRRYPRC